MLICDSTVILSIGQFFLFRSKSQIGKEQTEVFHVYGGSKYFWSVKVYHIVPCIYMFQVPIV